MKKIMIFIFALIYLFSVKNVWAQDQYRLTLQKQDGIYFSRRGSNFDDDSYPYYLYKFGDMYAYCLQPGKHFQTYDYVGIDNYVDAPFSSELMEKLELIGHFGRDYPGHDNIRYSMATQALIWELTGVDEVSFWTQQYEQGEEIDVTNEKNEIMRLVNKAKLLPNISSNIIGMINKEIIINDSNNVLSDYEIMNNSNNQIVVEGNKLKIVPKTLGDITFQLKYKKYDDLKTIIFVGKDNVDNQILGRLRFSHDKVMNINLSVKNIKLSVNKVDENNGRVSIAGIRFKIKDLGSNQYLCENDTCEYQTDNEGSFTTNYLPYGQYELEEVEEQLVRGYLWNNQKLKITINENTDVNLKDNDYYTEVSFTNQSYKERLIVFKKGQKAIFKNNQITYQENWLSDVEFTMHSLKNDNLIRTFKTGPDGIVKIYDILEGDYYLLEKTELEGYVPIKDKRYYTAKQYSQYYDRAQTVLYFYNILKKGTLEFTKKDKKTGVGIGNTTIEIYNNQGDLLLTRVTDASGKVIINNLPYGKYYIKEKEAGFGYQKTDEVLFFEIKENDEIVKVEMNNEKIHGILELNKYGEELIVSNNENSYQRKSLSNIEFNLYNESDELINTLVTNNDGYIKEEIELGKYYLKEASKLDNYQENTEKYSFEIINDPSNSVKIDAYNNLKKGNLEFSKIDSVTSEGISNTVIEIYDINNNLLITKKTNDKGKIIINNLPYGKYYIMEKEANYYYQKTHEKKHFEIKNNNETVKVTMTNKKIVGNLEIVKRGEKYQIIDNNFYYEKELLPNIEFSIYRENNEFVESIKTDKDGYIRYSGLTLGKYYLVEKTRLNNYLVNSDKVFFEIKKDGNKALDVKLEIDNYLKKGNLEFIKEDYYTADGLSDTVISVYNDRDELLITKKTNDKGKIIIDNLPYGKYYIMEKEANYYYQKTDEKKYFEIKKDNETVKVKMTNKQILGNLEIIKNGEKHQIIDNDFHYEKELLPNIEFSIYRDNNEFVESIKTDKNGYIKYSGLILGKYYLIEKTKLNNYVVNSDKIYFEIKKDGNKALDVKLEIDNYLKKGNLEFSKTDLVTSEGIPNTIIEVYDINNNLLITKETDEEGKIVINNLSYGKYYLIEKEANSMYQITNEKVFFEIKENGEIVKAQMTNEKKTIEVPKTDTKENIIVNSLLGISFLIGIGRHYYERKKAF